MSDNACDFAWAAGLFEGEGCLTWRRRPSGYDYPSAALTMTDEDVVRRFAEVIEVGKVTLPKRREDRKQQWLWRAFGYAAMVRLDETIGPYLGLRRGATLDEMLTFVPQRAQDGSWLAPRVFTEDGLSSLRASIERTRDIRYPPEKRKPKRARLVA